jgi:hypothetical protein
MFIDREENSAGFFSRKEKNNSNRILINYRLFNRFDTMTISKLLNLKWVLGSPHQKISGEPIGPICLLSSQIGSVSDVHGASAEN